MSSGEFNAGDPIAYFLTWTSYGTWLPGDERGSWHTGDWKPENELFREMADSEMRETAFFLSREDREIVESTVVKHCDIRKWQLYAVNARANHVHAVLTAFNYARIR